MNLITGREKQNVRCDVNTDVRFAAGTGNIELGFHLTAISCSFILFMMI